MVSLRLTNIFIKKKKDSLKIGHEPAVEYDVTHLTVSRANEGAETKEEHALTKASVPQKNTLTETLQQKANVLFLSYGHK